MNNLDIPKRKPRPKSLLNMLQIGTAAFGIFAAHPADSTVHPPALKAELPQRPQQSARLPGPKEVERYGQVAREIFRHFSESLRTLHEMEIAEQETVEKELAALEESEHEAHLRKAIAVIEKDGRVEILEELRRLDNDLADFYYAGEGDHFAKLQKDDAFRAQARALTERMSRFLSYYSDEDKKKTLRWMILQNELWNRIFGSTAGQRFNEQPLGGKREEE